MGDVLYRISNISFGKKQVLDKVIIMILVSHVHVRWCWRARENRNGRLSQAQLIIARTRWASSVAAVAKKKEVLLGTDSEMRGDHRTHETWMINTVGLKTSLFFSLPSEHERSGNVGCFYILSVRCKWSFFFFYYRHISGGRMALTIIICE